MGQLLFLLYTSELFSLLENKLLIYADDSYLMAVVPSPVVGVTVGESLIPDLGRCDGFTRFFNGRLIKKLSEIVMIHSDRNAV